MKRANPRLAAVGVTMLVVGILIGVVVEAPIPRLFGSATAIVIGFSLLRQAFRIE